MEAGLAGNVDPLVGQRRDDPRRRGLGKARFVGHLDDPGPFSLVQGMGRDRAIGIRPTVPLRQAVAGIPAPQRAGVDAGQGTGRG